MDERVASILKSVGELDDSFVVLSEHTLKDGLGIDSLGLFDVALAIEEKMGVQFGDDAIKPDFTVADLLTEIEKAKAE
jgi:acyl carrier protein